MFNLVRTTMKVCTRLQHPDKCEQEKKDKQMGLELIWKHKTASASQIIFFDSSA
jgi:hypothetical protein